MYLFRFFLFLMVYLNSSFAHEPKENHFIHVEDDIHNDLTIEEKKYLKAKKEIKICIDPNWFPFEKISKDGKHIGISSDYFSIFQNQIKTPIKLLKTTSWTETLDSAKSRKCDILTLGNATAEREKYLSFTKPYLKIPFILSTKNKQYYVKDIKHLRNKRVGVVKNSSLISTLKEKYPNLIIQEVKSDTDGLRQVQENKLFAHVGNMLSISYIIKKEFMNDLKIMNSLGEHSSNLAVGVRNDEALLLQIFTKLVNNLPEETHSEIMNKYLSISYEQDTNYKYIKELLVVALLILIIFAYIQYKLKQINKKLERKVEERTHQLLQQSRLAQMGEMISMIAHQWRQPLTAISATSNNLLIKMLIDGKIEKEELKKEISLISDYSQHLSLTIDDFRNFFKTDKDTSITTLEKIVKNSISIVKSSIDANEIEIKTDFNCNKDLNIFASEVNQVVLNLIRNAEEALVDNSIKNAEIIIKTYTENDNAVLEICDNAKGVAEGIIDKIFDPYFSTKKAKEGTGLGLYMSKIIINDHCNGSIRVRNGKLGAIFTVSIPLS